MPQLAVSFAIWYKSPVNPEQKYNIIQKGDLTLFCKNNDFYLALPEEKKLCSMPTDSNWHHLVFTILDMQAFLYVDGKTIGDPHNLVTSSVNATDNILIGAAQMDPDFLHRVTLFKHALEMDEVVQLYRRGKDKSVRDIPANPEGVVDYDAQQLSRSQLPIEVTGSAPLHNAPPLEFPTIYPFQVSLTNQIDQSSSAIYIVSDLARATDVQNLDLVIKNTTKDDFQFEAFTLAFRKGTLHENLTKDNAQKCCEILATAIGNKPQVTAKEEGGSIRFTVNTSTGQPFLLKANTALSLGLKGIYAAPGTGTRTSGYEVKFEAVQKMAGSNTSGPAFSFGRNAVLQIINHQGNSSAPVHFGVLGNNFLLNTHDSQEIAIFMQSLDGKPLAMNANTKFIFTFFAGESQSTYPYFGNTSEVDAITTDFNSLDAQKLKEEPKISVDEFNKRDIIIVPTAKTEKAFATFKFKNIQLSGPSGQVKVLVTVENLPGYWDSNFEVAFIKGPMVMVGNQVGIGVKPVEENALSVKSQAGQKAALQVEGGTHLDGRVGIMTQPDETNALSVNGNVSIIGDLRINSTPSFTCRAYGVILFKPGPNRTSPWIYEDNCENIIIDSHICDTKGYHTVRLKTGEKENSGLFNSRYTLILSAASYIYTQGDPLIGGKPLEAADVSRFVSLSKNAYWYIDILVSPPPTDNNFICLNFAIFG